MIGDAVTGTVNWHRNGNQKKVKHPLYTSNDPKFVVIYARDGDDSGSVHAPSYTTMRDHRIRDEQAQELAQDRRGSAVELLA